MEEKARIGRTPFLICLAVTYFLILLIDGFRVHLYCDEISFLKNVSGFFIYRTVEPLYSNYPTFYSYLLALPIYLAYGIWFLFFRHFPEEGLFDPRLFALVFQTDLDIWLWIGRLISMGLAVAIMVVVYNYAVRRWGRLISGLVLFFLIVSPYSFYMAHARYALPDILVAFLVTAVMALAVSGINKPDMCMFNLAGFLAGLAASAKINGLVALAPLLLLPWLTGIRPAERWRSLAAVLFWCAFGFFVGSPCNVLKPGLYSHGFGQEAQLIYSTAHDFSFSWLLQSLWREDPFFTLLMIAGMGYSFWRHSSEDKLFHAILIPAVIFLGGLAKQTPYYLLFLFPWICIIIGQMLHKMWQLPRTSAWRWFIVALMLCAVAFESYRLGERLWLDSRRDNRDLAREWIIKNIPSQERILLDVDNVPRLSFIDIGVMSMEEYIHKNRFRSVVKAYADKELFPNIGVLQTFTLPIEQLKNEGWRYFVSSEASFRPYLNGPDDHWAVENGPNRFFIEYLARRSFYIQLFRDAEAVWAFRQGSGPSVYVFRLLD